MITKDSPTKEQVAQWRSIHCDGRNGWSAEDMVAMLIRGELSVAECRRAIAGSRTADREPWEYGNPMESDDLLMTHVMYDNTNGDTYVVALRGQFFATSREAPERIARAAGIPKSRLYWNCHLSEHDGTVLRVRLGRDHSPSAPDRSLRWDCPAGRLIAEVVRPGPTPTPDTEVAGGHE